MKVKALLLALSVLAGACGTKEDRISDSGTYAVRQDLSVSGSIVLSFQQTYPNRSIVVGRSQSTRCLDFAKDYEAQSGVTVQADTLKLTYDENPGRHCSRRSATKRCENYQYIYTFNCQFQSQ